MSAREPRPDWLAWLDQAEHDLEGAHSAHSQGFWDHALVLAEQAAEKAVKAVWIARRGVLAPRVHFVGQLLGDLGAPGDLQKAGTALARGYFTVRYPPVEDPAPFRHVESADSDTAITDAKRILGWAREQLPDDRT